MITPQTILFAAVALVAVVWLIRRSISRRQAARAKAERAQRLEREREEAWERHVHAMNSTPPPSYEAALQRTYSERTEYVPSPRVTPYRSPVARHSSTPARSFNSSRSSSSRSYRDNDNDSDIGFSSSGFGACSTGSSDNDD